MITMEELSKKTVFELKAYAKKNNIELFESKTKLEILEILASWFPPQPAQVETSTDEKVAVFATRNLHSRELGTLTPGFNIISGKIAEEWLKHKAVRTATPDEVARAYGK